MNNQIWNPLKKKEVHLLSDELRKSVREEKPNGKNLEEKKSKKDESKKEKGRKRGTFVRGKS